MGGHRRDRGRARHVVDALTVIGLVAAISVLGPAELGGVAGAVRASAPGPDEDAAERAAREITAARERANALADEMWATQSAYDVLRDEESRLVVEIERVEDSADQLRGDVESIAVSRFVASGSAGIPVLTDVRAPNERVRAEVLVGVAADVGAGVLDDFDAARTELDALRRELTANRAASERQQARLQELRSDAEAEVERLRTVERRRLEDEAVQLALAAQRREEERAREEAERRAAEAARRAETQAAAAAEDEAAAGSATPGPVTTPGPGASGSAAGGRTGGTGGGSVPGSAFVDGSITCPVVGGSAYGDTWGAPRSGGRRHQGVDMMAPTGTPLVAVVAGTVEHRRNRLGGTTVSLMGDNGHRYYYAHLSHYEGDPGAVPQGRVIGYVGDTGNATGVPHLHFEIRPGAGVPVNPTPSVRAAGC
ncbi:MAG: peptidoglycan DD-metalloendopeptidase family protein [Ilumatobacteraceae bacterium]